MAQSDITNLEQLAALLGQVVKCTTNGGDTWRYTKLSTHGPHYFADGAYGFCAKGEVNDQGVHGMYDLTDQGFAKGMVVRSTTPEEVTGKKFSYE